MKLHNPWPTGRSINKNSPYGWRVHPITGKRKKHRGVDVGYKGLVRAPADGKVVHKGADLNKRTGGGYTLILEHSEPRVWTVYYHLREPSPLRKGTKVKRGEVIAYTGSTGASTGVHLHFETRRSRSWGTDFDPETILGQAQDIPKPDKPKLVEDGAIGLQTWGAVQRMLQADGFYKGRINGVPGKSTVLALQKFLNRGGW